MQRFSYTRPHLVAKPVRAPARQLSVRTDNPRARIPPQVATEIRATISAIGKLQASLAASGLHWSDVAAALVPDQQPELPWESPPPQDKSPDGVRWMDRAELLALVAEITRRSPPSLGERSRAFLAGLGELAAEFPVVRLSPKQSNWLDGLAKDAGLAEAERGG